METTTAPCGMDCRLCHSFQRKNCSGCRSRQSRCVLRNCKRKNDWCFECDRFPCKRLKVLDSKYRTEYAMSMLENLIYIREHGEAAFLMQQTAKYTCLDCGKLRTVHYDYCIFCKQERGR